MTLMIQKTPIAVIEGDGIGPEVVQSALAILKAVEAPIEPIPCLAGKAVFLSGDETGVPAATIQTIQDTQLCLKGPLETPVGHGEKSANVTLRQCLQTFANIRPVFQLPHVPSRFADLNLSFIVVRENLEDLYMGIEYPLTHSVAESLKIISEYGSNRISRFSFELAKALGKKSVHCATKANILKLTEGLFKRCFEDVSRDYTDIKALHHIVDNCAHQLVVNPSQYDILVMSNMNGDILSDLASGLVGGLGLAPSVNFGEHAAIFEAVHGSAPDIAGKNCVNPTAMILSSVMMLYHMGLAEHACRIEKALMKTFEKGHFTQDLCQKETQALSTSEFTECVIANLDNPSSLNCVLQPLMTQLPIPKTSITSPPKKTNILGIDLFIETTDSIEAMKSTFDTSLEDSPFKLVMAQVISPGLWRVRLAIKESGNTIDTLFNDTIANTIKIIGTYYPWSQVTLVSH